MPLQRLVSDDSTAQKAEQSSGTCDLHITSLMPLREQDANELVSLFEREDSEDIEADISRKLVSIWPEPCWEDEFIFLRDYL